MSTALVTAYRSSLAQLEEDLHHQQTQFPVSIELAGQQYQFSIWQGQQLPDTLLAYDTETRPIQDREVPELALVCVYGDRGSSYFIHPDQLPQFIRLHADRYWCCHNAVFDFWVTAQALQTDPQTCALWWDIAGSSRLYCTMLGDALIRLGRIDSEPINRNLGVVAAEYCGLQIDKDDPFRLRYAELIGLSVSDWQNTAPGFWQYGGKDPIATLLVAQRQFQIAAELIEPHRSQLLPDALKRFGPLSCTLQVMGSIALDYASRVGVSVDLHQAQQLQFAIGQLVTEQQKILERLLPGCFKRYGPRSKKAGELQCTAAGVARERLRQLATTCDSANMNEAETLSKQQLAKRYAVSCKTIERWEKSGILPPAIRIGGVVRFRRADVEQREQEQQQEVSVEQSR